MERDATIVFYRAVPVPSIIVTGITMRLRHYKETDGCIALLVVWGYLQLMLYRGECLVTCCDIVAQAGSPEGLRILQELRKLRMAGMLRISPILNI